MEAWNRENLSAHVPRLYRVALRILGNHHSAEEIVQEVCVRVLEQNSDFSLRPNVLLSTWLHRVTVNCALDRVRREGLEERSRNQLGADRFTRPATTPDQIVERQELFLRAASLVETLPDDCRMSFILTQIDGYSYDEAAEIEDKPRGTIASRVFRAKALLLTALSEART